MTVVLLFVAGLVGGALLESLWHAVRDAPKGAAPGEVGAGAGRSRRRLRPGRVVVVGLALLVVMGLVAGVVGYAYAKGEFDKIEKVPVGALLQGSAGGTNYLMVGTDNRPEAPGNRSDTMLVLRIADGRSTLMSIPRDLYVTIPGRDGQHRINTAYNDGPAKLVETVQQSLQIPIDRYVEINFMSFGSLVDALGGVTINFPYPASDPGSGLNITQTGDVRLTGEQALQYVRARHYTEVIDGETRVDPTSDLGRVQRQQQFLRSVMAEAGSSRNPFELMKIGRSLSNGLKVDDHMTVFDAARFAWDMGKLNPESVELPTTPTTTDGGAAVLLLRQPEAEAALALFRG